MNPKSELGELSIYQLYLQYVDKFVYYASTQNPENLNPQSLVEGWRLFSEVTNAYSILRNSPMAKLGVTEIFDCINGNAQIDRHLIDIGLIFFTSKTGLGEGSTPFEALLRLGKEDRIKARDFSIKMRQAVYLKIMSPN